MVELKITGFSSALYSTWFFVEPFRLLFDCGDGVSALLGPKSRKIKTVAITHADRDHLFGLVQLNQLNAHDGAPTIYYPSHCGSFPVLAQFSQKFDPHIQGQARWVPIADQESVDFDKLLILTARANAHKPAEPGETKSVGFDVSRKKKKLRAEYQGLARDAIAALAKEHGPDHVNETITEKLLSYSGDTPVGQPERWNGTPLLIHECTFLDRDAAGSEIVEHTCLPQLLDMLAQAEVGKVILSHFSARYSCQDVTEAVRREAASRDFPHPIWVVPPAVLVTDVLSEEPVWQPAG